MVWNNTREREMERKRVGEKNPPSRLSLENEIPTLSTDTEILFSASPRFRISVSLLIAVSIILVTVLHFLTPLDQIVFSQNRLDQSID